MSTPETHDWAASLDTLHARAWARLARGVADRRAAGRHPTLATVDGQGRPQARTVVLRSADPQAAVLQIYTDLHSDKVDELRRTPHAAVQFWDSSAHLQIRLLADADILSGEAVSNIWATLSASARDCYGHQPSPGEPLSDGLGYHRQPAATAFAVLQLWVQEMDILHLGRQHRRARFVRADGWTGQWIVP